MCLDNLKTNKRSYNNLLYSEFWGQLSMESRPQNPVFRINPENFHPWCGLFYFFHEVAHLKCLIEYLQLRWVQQCKCLRALVVLVHTHYHNSYLIWRIVSRRVDEAIPSDHLRRLASRVIRWYGLIHETWYCTPDQVTIMIICLLYAFFLTFFLSLKPVLVFNPEKLRERLP